MWKSFDKLFFVFSLLSLTLLAGCAAQASSGQAASAVEGYLRALAAKDENQMISASCADWEAQAKVEYNSFSAVDLTLEDLECRETGSEGNLTFVSCTGTMVANYGVEDLEINVADRTYTAVEEGGEWRMCGYK